VFGVSQHAIASNVAPPKIDVSIVSNLSNTELPSLLRTTFHLLCTPMMDARPDSHAISDRLMFFMSSLNTKMPERQNSIAEMYSWTVLTPYVEELVSRTALIVAVASPLAAAPQSVASVRTCMPVLT
jgi:hypothetical protein